MKCKRCHKELKNPKSVQNGYGPVCWSKMLAAHPVVVGETNNEISFVPKIWTTAHGRTVIL